MYKWYIITFSFIKLQEILFMMQIEYHIPSRKDNDQKLNGKSRKPWKKRERERERERKDIK